MRTILSPRSVLAMLLVGTTFQAFPQKIINLMGITNQVWRYNQTGVDLTGTGWQLPNYDDSGWPEGRSVLAHDDAAQVVRLKNTELYLTYPGNTAPTITYYFRTHFQFSGIGSHVRLYSTNFIDDGAVFYLNGTEVSRFAMPDGPINASTLSSISGGAASASDGVRFTYMLTNANLALVAGDNVLAVEIHQRLTNSNDITWGTDLGAIIAYAPEITEQPMPTNVLQGRSATLRVIADAEPPPSYQWFHEFEPIPGAISSNYTLSNMDSTQAGQYYVSVQNPFGGVDSAIVSVRYIPDDRAPVLLSAVGLPYNPERVILQFNESVTGALTPSFYQLTFQNGDPNPPAVSLAAYSANSNQVVLTLDAPLDPSRVCDLTINSAGALRDYFANSFPEPFRGPIIFPAILQILWSTNAGVRLAWTPGLQPYQSDRLTGPWTPLNLPSNPATLPIAAGARFFVLRPISP